MKIGIIGVGKLGRALAFCVAYNHLATEIVLIDKNQDKAKKVALDMEQGSSLLTHLSISAGGYELLMDAQIIVVTAGHPRKKTESRLDLTTKNQEIVTETIGNVIEYNQSAILLMATDPVDIMTYIALKISGFPKQKVIGLGTFLDTLRLNSLVAKTFNYSPADVDLMVIGEHGQSMVPVLSRAQIKGILLKDLPDYDEQSFNQLLSQLIKSGDELIALDSTSVFTPSLAIGKILEAIIYNRKVVLPVSTYISGAYDIKNIVLSLPAKIGSEGIEDIVEIPLSEEELNALKISSGIIKSEIESL
jgi:L-lactate dehydrogenase